MRKIMSRDYICEPSPYLYRHVTVEENMWKICRCVNAIKSAVGGGGGKHGRNSTLCGEQVMEEFKGKWSAVVVQEGKPGASPNTIPIQVWIIYLHFAGIERPPSFFSVCGI